MIGWMIKLCVLCATSAVMQMALKKGPERETVGMVFGLLMLHMTCESAAQLLYQICETENLMQLFLCLMK